MLHEYKKYILFFSIIFTLLIINSCNRSILSDSIFDGKFGAFPNTIRIGENLYIDRSEITNLYYKEYAFWVMKNYGKDSPQYRESLIDTLVWEHMDDCLDLLPNKYYREPSFDYLPLVGISYEQAQRYSKWRNDRIFQMILINSGILKYDKSNPADSIITLFTIEDYMDGKYPYHLPSGRIKYVPNGRLPTKEEFHIAQLIQNKSEYKNKDTPFTNFNPCVEGKLIYPPTRSTDPEDYVSRQYIIDINGNLSEMTNIKGESFGDNWYIKSQRPTGSEMYEYTEANAWTGFRCAFEYKEYNKK